MNRWKIGLVGVIVVAIAAIAYAWLLIGRGFSAREKPSALEVVIAQAARNMATPSSATNEKNPLTATAEILNEGRRHFADHCAICHANDGSGQTEIGQNLYPKAPDMRLPGTQGLTDGQIYYIIHNGVRLTGMPAWGETHGDNDSWKLVLFIRHLPNLTVEEKKDMERFNPVSPMEHIEEEKENKFLSGDKPSGKPAKPPHRH